MRVPREVRPPLDVDMTPLIDVTFLLMIFFMVVSVFNDMEREAKVELPATYYQAQIEKEVAKERMVINVEADGAIVLYSQRMDMPAFREALRRYAPGLRALGATGTAPIVLRGHKACPFRHVRDVLAAIYEEDFTKIMFAAYAREEEEE